MRARGLTLVLDGGATGGQDAYRFTAPGTSLNRRPRATARPPARRFRNVTASRPSSKPQAFQSPKPSKAPSLPKPRDIQAPDARDPVFARAACAAPHHLAAEAGRAILAEGGNAVEAMLAMAATIAVVYPHMNGLGGDGFWLIRGPTGVVRAIEACGPAGSLATIERYRDKGYETIPERGPDAALTVAGAVGGWALAHEIARDLGGRLPLDLVLSDAVRHAREGVAVSASEARYVPKELDTLHDQPGFKDTFLVDGEPPKAGVKRALPALAATLEQLGHAGLDDFYRGDVGREIAADLERAGSPVTRADIRATGRCRGRRCR